VWIAPLKSLDFPVFPFTYQRYTSPKRKLSSVILTNGIRVGTGYFQAFQILYRHIRNAEVMRSMVGHYEKEEK